MPWPRFMISARNAVWGSDGGERVEPRGDPPGRFYFMLRQAAGGLDRNRVPLSRHA
jgi:hypothetical protein